MGGLVPTGVIKGELMCDCPEERTGGLPPCGKAEGHKRPDGWYCDCGHEVECCAKYIEILRRSKWYSQ